MEVLGMATLLVAINELLATIGEDPLEDLDIMPPSANIAKTVLYNTSRDLQEEGHWFNEETDYELVPDATSKEIFIPQNILRIDSIDGDCIRRGNRLYDKTTKSFKFNAPVMCDVTLHLSFGDLPQVARRFITALSVEKFIEAFPIPQGTTEARLRNLARAKVAFETATIKNGDYNLLGNSSIQSSMRRS